ncbi:inositol monophosphatase family protein [Cryptosporangium sp. NPDC051539]|uniref:inositol monophosphatase family protein n=1 Tax=Cryptosporangium sp. NPDC051539 TaxID=3363962 RepID=UPI0037985E6D
MAITDPDLAIVAAQTGAATVRSRFGTSLARVDKGGGDFATAADLESERAIVEILRTARPGDVVVGEEGGRSGAGDSDRVWLVDPLCGTLNYTAHTRLVAVNVALRIGAEVPVAAAADPFTGEVFWTDGVRAFLRRGGADEPLAPSGDSGLVDVDVEPPFPNAPRFRAVHLLADPGFAARFRPRMVSTSLAVAWVAAGRRAAYVTDNDVWDNVHFAAGIALCRAAGCVVTGLRGQPLHSGVGGLVAAADRATHDELLALIERQF